MKLKLGSALVVLGAGMLLGACGSDEDTGSANTEATTSLTTTPASTVAPSSSAGSAGTAAPTFNDADVTFVHGMIPHHEQAVAMAEIALDPAVGASAEVVDLATRIKSAQDPEIQLMNGWLSAWGQPMTMDTAGGGHEMSDMGGMMSAEEMDELGAMKGGEFDAMWMQMMIKHHEGAITQATTEKDAGVNPDALALADQIITAQQAEIAEMQTLLAP